MVVSRWILVRMTVFQIDLVEKLKTHILCSINFSSENRNSYNIMWKRYGRSGQNTDDNIIQRIRFPCWITKDTNTHLEYVILVCPWRQWFRERVPILRYTKLLCPSCFVVLLCQHFLFIAGAEKNTRSSYFRDACCHNKIKDLVSAPVGLWNECISNPTFINYKRITIYKVGACKTHCRRTSDNN